jgi:hypothetical protein
MLGQIPPVPFVLVVGLVPVLEQKLDWDDEYEELTQAVVAPHGGPKNYL